MKTILSYFNSGIQPNGLDLNLEWQQGLKVAFRLQWHLKSRSPNGD